MTIRPHHKRIRLTLLVLVAIVLGAGLLLLAQLNTLNVQSQRLVFLKREGRASEAFWSVDPAHPEIPRHIHEVDGIPYEYDISPDGTFIVYGMRPFGGQYEDLYRLNVDSGEATRLTTCSESGFDCSAPAIRPDGRWLAYQQVEQNAQRDAGDSRIWLLDLENTADTSLLIDDPQVYGHVPVWSPDGSRLAFYDPRAGGIVVLDFETRDAAEGPTLQFVLSGYGKSGTFSPDGTLLVYPEIIVSEQGPTRAFLQIADLERDLTLAFSDPGTGASDEVAVWSPDGRSMTIGRRFVEGGGGQTQIYLWDAQTESVVPLVRDPLYNHSAMRWSPDGAYLAFMRLPQANPAAEASPVPEVWVYELASGNLRQVAENARLPQWLP